MQEVEILICLLIAEEKYILHYRSSYAYCKLNIV